MLLQPKLLTVCGGCSSYVKCDVHMWTAVWIFCYVQANDEDNRRVVEMFGIIIQVLASEVHW